MQILKERAMNAKKLVVAGVLGLVVTLAAGTEMASAAPYYRRPVVYRPYYGGVWRPPVYPYAYTYPTYPAPAVYGYAPYCTPGVYVGAPAINVGLGFRR